MHACSVCMGAGPAHAHARSCVVRACMRACVRAITTEFQMRQWCMARGRFRGLARDALGTRTRLGSNGSARERTSQLQHNRESDLRHCGGSGRTVPRWARPTQGEKPTNNKEGFTVGIRIRLILNQFLAVAEDDIAICIGRSDRERVVVQVAARVYLREWHAWIGSTSSNMSTQTNAKRGGAYPGVGCEARLHDHIDAVTAREYERERANDCTHPLEKGPLTARGAQDVDAG